MVQYWDIPLLNIWNIGKELIPDYEGAEIQ